MKRVFLTAVFGLLITMALPASARKWTSSDGQFTTDAELVESTDEKVTLKKKSGETVVVPVELLSELDRRYLRAQKKKATTPVKENKKAAPPVQEIAVSYAKEVQPFLLNYCSECHSPGKAKDGYDVTTMAALTKPGKNGTLVIPGKPGESRLIEVMRGISKSMPPNKKPQPMPEEITKIAAWIEAGGKEDAAGQAQPNSRFGKGRSPKGR